MLGAVVFDDVGDIQIRRDDGVIAQNLACYFAGAGAIGMNCEGQSTEAIVAEVGDKPVDVFRILQEGSIEILLVKYAVIELVFLFDDEAPACIVDGLAGTSFEISL